jgi:hypothetical protein
MKTETTIVISALLASALCATLPSFVATAQTVPAAEVKAIAADAYLYAYPMLYNHKTIGLARAILGGLHVVAVRTVRSWGNSYGATDADCSGTRPRKPKLDRCLIVSLSSPALER